MDETLCFLHRARLIVGRHRGSEAPLGCFVLLRRFRPGSGEDLGESSGTWCQCFLSRRLNVSVDRLDLLRLNKHTVEEWR